MPKGERKTYSKEFKLSAVYLLMSKACPPKEVFRMLEIDRQTVYRWVQEFKESGEKAFEKKAVLPGDEVAANGSGWTLLQWKNQPLAICRKRRYDGGRHHFPKEALPCATV